MKSLTQLNTRGIQSFEFTDQRAPQVFFNPLQPSDVIQTISTTAVNISPTIEIIDIINPTEANIRFRVRIVTGSSPELTGSSLVFQTLPASLTLTTVGNTSTISGITTLADWDIVKDFVWILPSNFTTFPLWYLDIAILYYDGERDEEMVVDWEVYDPRFYFISKVTSTATVECIPTAPVIVASAVINSNAQVSSSINKVVSVSANLSSEVSVNAIGSKSVTNLIAISSVSAKFRGDYRFTAALSATASLSCISKVMTVTYAVTSTTTPISITLTGVSNATIFWGDTTSTNISADGTYTKTYASTGTKRVQVSGNFTGFQNNSSTLASVINFPHQGLVKLSGLGTNLSAIPNQLPSSVTDLTDCFRRITGSTLGFSSPSITSWDVSNVINMSGMFRDSTDFNQNIGSWNVSNVRDMSFMFRGSDVFNQSLNSWNVSNVTDMNYMFSQSIYNQPLNNWNTSSVTDMSNMFSETVFNQPLNNWNVSNVTDMSFMFSNSVFNQLLTTWNVFSVTNMTAMFSSSVYNQLLTSWDTSSVTSMASMFSYSLYTQPLNALNVSNVTSMSGMFSGAIYNQPLDLWNVSNVLDMSSMFQDNQEFNQPLNGWDVSNVTNMRSMFRNTVFNQVLAQWDTSSVTFTGATIGGVPVTGMNDMFRDNTDFNQFINTWCVDEFLTKPSGFDTNTNASWTIGKKPVWGTCP